MKNATKHAEKLRSVFRSLMRECKAPPGKPSIHLRRWFAAR